MDFWEKEIGRQLWAWVGVRDLWVREFWDKEEEWYFEWGSARGNSEWVTVWRIFDWSSGFCYYLVANWFLTLLGSPHVLYIACQAPLSIGFLRQEYWSVLAFPSPGILRTQGSNQSFLHCQVDSLPLSHLGSHERRWWQGILRGNVRGNSERRVRGNCFKHVCQNEKPLWIVTS